MSEIHKMAIAIQELIRERDEARAIIRAGTDEIAEYYERLMDAKVGTAEQRGYRKGVEDAIAAGGKATPFVEQWSFRRAAILALLEQTAEGIPQKVRTAEQTGDTNSPNPER